MTKAEEDVLAERAKQRNRWGDDHDDAVESNGELPTAAAFLAHPDPDPFVAPTWAGTIKSHKERRQQLVCAAALVIAEIDRMDRQ